MLRWTLGCTCLFQIWLPWCVCPEVGSLVFLAGKCHGQSSLRGCSPRAVKSQIQLSRLSRAPHDVSYKVSKQPQRGSYCCFILQVVKLSQREAKWCVQRCTVRQQRGLGLTPRQAVTTAKGVHQIQCPFQKSGSRLPSSSHAWLLTEELRRKREADVQGMEKKKSAASVAIYQHCQPPLN